ncbi:uncharacterized protein LOC141910295 [Tubulanus polymorphus]|uniref:uncharacterized protein LOC141910295 n=1 Tax=Tubulanus polymorphus TaxID=672921 RepID=UPI003DA2970B
MTSASESVVFELTDDVLGDYVRNRLELLDELVAHAPDNDWFRWCDKRQLLGRTCNANKQKKSAGTITEEKYFNILRSDAQETLAAEAPVEEIVKTTIQNLVKGRKRKCFVIAGDDVVAKEAIDRIVRTAVASSDTAKDAGVQVKGVTVEDEENEDVLYQCGQCDMRFPNRSEVLVHVQTHTSDAIYDLCNDCGYMGMCAQDLNAHACAGTIGTNTVPGTAIKQAHCPICNTPYSTVNYLRVHLRNMHQFTVLYACDRCPMRFETNAAKIAHSRATHVGRKHVCAYCPKTFQSPTLLYGHIAIRHKKKVIPAGSEVKGGANVHVVGSIADSEIIVGGVPGPSPDQSAPDVPLDGKGAKIGMELKPDCMRCGISFQSMSDYRNHVKNQHGNVHVCEFCGKAFKTFARYGKHIGTHTTRVLRGLAPVPDADAINKNNWYICDHCGKESYCLSHHRKHVLNVHKLLVRFKCERCGETFNSSAEKKAHRKRHAPITHPCTVCGATFARPALLRAHTRVHTPAAGPRSFICAECGKTLVNASALRVHRLRHHRATDTLLSHQCAQCELTFPDEASLCEHLDVHGSATLACPFSNNGCDYTANRNDLLEDHVIGVHKAPKIYPCATCGQMFALCEFANCHEYKCSKPKRTRVKAIKRPQPADWPCLLCDKVFPVRRYLTRHLKRHSGARPFKCDLCDKGFTTKSTLNEHKNLHSGEKPFVCSLCNVGFAYNATLRQHNRRHHPKQPSKEKYFGNSAPMTAKVDVDESKVFADQFLDNGSPEDDSIFDGGATSTMFDVPEETCESIPKFDNTEPDKLIYRCFQCGQDFETRVEIMIHIRSHSEVPIHDICQHCGQACVSADEMREHAATCVAPAAAALRRTASRKREKTAYTCTVCGERYQSLMYYRRHMANQHDVVVPYTCKKCGAEFATNVDKMLHLRTHQADDAHQCRHCGKTFKFQSLLFAHIDMYHAKIMIKNENNEYVVNEQALNIKMDDGAAVAASPVIGRPVVSSDNVENVPVIEGAAADTAEPTTAEIFGQEVPVSRIDIKSETNTEENEQEEVAMETASSADLEGDNENVIEDGVVKEEGEVNDSEVEIEDNDEKDDGDEDEGEDEMDDYVYNSDDEDSEDEMFCPIKQVENVNLNNVEDLEEIKMKMRQNLCPKCGAYLKKMADLRRHYQVNHGLNLPYFCSLCNDSAFATARHYNNHNVVVHNNTSAVDTDILTPASRKRNADRAPIQCDICKRKFSRWTLLRSHYLTAHGVKMQYKCEKCDHTFATAEEKVEHRKTHGLMTYKCDECPRMFRRPGRLVVHKYEHLRKRGETFHDSDDDTATTNTGDAADGSGQTYACKQCDQKYANKFLLREHLNSDHAILLPYNCKYCTESCPTALAKKQHMAEHLKDKICDVCGCAFMTTEKMIQHRATHVSRVLKGLAPVAPHREPNAKPVSRTVKCNICEHVFYKNAKLRAHLLNVHGIVLKFKCRRCPLKFVTIDEKYEHERGHPLPVHTCPHCGKSFNRPYKLKCHIRTHTKEPRDPNDPADGVRYMCDVCGRALRSAATFKRHMELHTRTGAETYPCKICGKLFRSRSSVYSHIRVHDAKYNECEMCNFTTPYKYRLRDHIAAVHVNERAFECQICQKAFTLEKLLKNHQRSCHGLIQENGDYIQLEWPCSLCDKKFTAKRYLALHLHRHDMRAQGKKEFFCTLCDKGFTAKNSLNEHMNMHTGKRPYSCPFCPQKFPNSAGLFMHKKKIHPDLVGRPAN